MTRAPGRADRVACPNCGTEVEIGEALARSIRAELDAEARAESERRARAHAEQQAALELRERDVALRSQHLERDLAERVEARLREEGGKVRASALATAAAEKQAELEALEARLAKQDAELRASKQAELALLEQKQELERAREDVDLTVARTLDEERPRIREQAKAEAEERRRLELAQRDTQIDGMRRTIEELRKKADQGSQQLQGEALEVSLEQLLSQAFAQDGFEPVPKGIRGADLVQRVRNGLGQDCGTILWEAKRTKNWTDAWLPKLNDDKRALKAELAVLVSTVLPGGARPPLQVENVWIVDHGTAVGLALALRQGLIEVAAAKQALVGRQDKMQLLYAYLSGPEFRNRVEGLLEPFKALREDLEAEKRAMQKHWARREKQIERATISTAGLYGDLEGILGASLPELEGLSFPPLGEG